MTPSRVKVTVLAVLTVFVLLGNSAPGAQTNFSQREGFAEWRAQQRRDAHRADAQMRELLERYRPRFILPADHPGLIDFYGDYMASGELQLGDGRVIAAPIDAATLNEHQSDPLAIFVHRPPLAPAGTAVVYARADPLRVTHQGREQILQVLTWHAVFRHSGLPAGVEGFAALLAAVGGDLHDWHQLDHYTAVSLLLDARQRPVALSMQQHNYQRTWLLGESINLPADGRARVDVALRSNELFAAQDGAHWRRAVRYADADGMRYLLGFAPPPLMAAHDYTHGVREAEYRLEFLPTDDAFYLFEGYLGERRLLPGRSGPPGAGYNTVPSLKPLELQMFVGYWREGSADDLQRFEQHAVIGGSRRAFAEAQRDVFFNNLACLQRSAKVCS